MLIWKGASWSIKEIETETLLPSDLPKVVEDTYRGEVHRFVLAGNCGDIPLYKQQ